MRRLFQKKSCNKPNSTNKSMSILHTWALLVALLMFGTGQPLMAAEILVGGVLNQNTVWSGQNTYVVVETVEVPNGITLRIEAGTVILFNQGSGLRVEGGRLLIHGNENDSVYMLPNHHPGDSWYWKGLTISGNAKPDYVEITFSHIAHAETGITGNTSNLVALQNNSIKNNLLSGVVINNASAWQIMHNRIENNIRGIEIRADNPDSQSANNIIHGNYLNNDNINIYLESTNFSPCMGNTIEYNLLQGAEKGVFMFNTSQGISMDNLVERNILFEHGTANGGFGIQSSMDRTSIQNNIFYRNPTALEITAEHFQIMNNSFYDNIRDLFVRENTAEASILNNNFSAAVEEVVAFLSAEGIVFSGNNIMGNTALEGGIKNDTPDDILVENNFWDTIKQEVIEQMLYDGNDDPALGMFLYEPFLETPSIFAPMSPPLRVFAQHVHDETRVWWQAGKEASLVGYRVYFGDFIDYAFADVVDEIFTDTVVFIPHLEASGIGITSLNDLWSQDHAQLLGYESVYGMAVFVPWAGDDASICATQALYNIKHSTAPSNGGTLSWSSSGDGAFSNPSILRPVYFPGTADRNTGMVTLTLTVETENESLSDSFVLKLWPKPQVDAGRDAIISPGEPFVTGQATASHHHQLRWETTGDGMFSHTDSLKTTYHAGPQDIATGKAQLTLTAVSLYCGEVSSTISLYIKDTFSVSGRVTNEHQKLSHHPVIATRLVDAFVDPLRALAFTNNDGLFRFDDLYEGMYVFYSPADTSDHVGFLSAYHPVYSTWQDAYVHLLQGETWELGITLMPPKFILPVGDGVIEGHFTADNISVFDADTYCQPWFGGHEDNFCEQGLSNVSILLLGESEQVIYRHALTDLSGRFSFRGLPFGKYVLKAEMAGYESETSASIELSPDYPTLEDVSVFFNDVNTIVFSLPDHGQVAATPLHLYPNPANNLLVVEHAWLENTTPAVLSIYNNLGRLMMTERIWPAGQQIQTSVEHLPAGLYVLHLQSGQRVFRRTFLKQ